MRKCNLADPWITRPSSVRGYWCSLLLLMLLTLSGCATTGPEKATEPTKPPVTQKEFSSEAKKKQPPATNDRPDGMISEARRLVEKNRNNDALALFRRVIQEFENTPEANEARYRMGELLLLQGQEDSALKALTDAAARSNQPFSLESAQLLGNMLEQRGDLPGAWIHWLRVAYTPSTPQATDAWQRFLKSYLKHGTPENTQRALQTLPAGQLSPDQARMALATIDQQDTDRLKQLHAIQPPGSPLTPLIALILGDRQNQEGSAQGAQSFWQSARTNDLTAQEAQRRLGASGMPPELTLGLLLPLSGEYESIGKNLLKAAQKALRDAPDTRIVLRVSDSRGKADEARRAMEQFRADGIGAVIGPVFQEEAKAAAEVAASYNIPIITLNPRSGIVQPGSSILQNAFRPESEGQVMARFAVEEKNLRRIAILAPDTEYGHLLTEAFSETVHQSGGTIVRATFYPSGSRDFSPWIKALVNADPKDLQARARNNRKEEPLDPVEPLASGKESSLRPWTDFDALFIPANAQEVRLIIPQAAFFKLRQPEITFLGTSLWNKPELFREGTDFLQGAFFCDTDDVARNRFNTSFFQTWKETPSSLDMLAYDSIALVAQSLREARMSGQSWYTLLKGGQQVQGAAGIVYFDENGQSRRNYFLYRIDADGPRKTESMVRQDPVTPPPAPFQAGTATPMAPPGALPPPGSPGTAYF
ncbi:MAG: penicillin-binding protein activator [Magnetococcales bacterium]|nr:penicillin-binding protein activator [Magnetococcales bacterium]MBF0151719.1 penicillin-binding protein activator [Magnetococcales bacterium]MBF0347200.1 penicillin-binding protein activator [Magnetococcales bacterium]MBF0630474.1 penicillin-binding protein activator [Magnetococcales bacterium]